MSTQKPLIQLVPELSKYIKSNQERLEHGLVLQNIFEGQLLPYLLALLKGELNPRAYERIVPRVVPINVLTRIINKLSTLYSYPVKRVSDTPIDQEIMDQTIIDAKLNTTFGLANKLYSLHQYLAIEPFFHNGQIKTRILEPSQFLIFSDDIISKEMTVFLKFMGNLSKNKQLWFAYSDEEFLAFDTDGAIHSEFLFDNEGVNPLGQIPFIYINQYSTKLMPQRDTDVLEMTLRIPQLLSDLNYAHKYQAHSMIYGIDIQPDSDIDGSPDGFTMFSSTDKEGTTGRIDFLKPQIEIEASIKLVISELGLWLETKGIKAGTIGQADSSMSGIAKILDEMDTTQARQEQVDIFKYMEDAYWKLYSKLHNFYLSDLEEKRGMTDDPLSLIKFTEQKPLEDGKTVIEKAALKLTNGLTSKKRAIAEANPELDPEQVEELIKEIDEEKTVIPTIPSIGESEE